MAKSETTTIPTLDQVVAAEWPVIEALAADAPEESAPAVSSPSPAYKQSPKGTGKGGTAPPKRDLGPLDVPRYLEAHGIPYAVKAKGSKKLYVLNECLFDSDHGRGDASIIQDLSGKLAYYCFHDSCDHYTWADARRKISGDESLAPFCEGYDPDWKPSFKKNGNGTGGGKRPWLIEREGKRPTFVPAYLANHVEEKYTPLVHEGKEFGNSFYRYDPCGVWKWLATSEVQHYMRSQLGNHAKSAWVNDALQLLQWQVYQGPETLESDPYWINLQNGMFNVETGELKPHGPDWMSRVQLPVKYDEDAKCTLWGDTLAEIFEDDIEKILTIQDFLGYCLYPRIIFPAALFCIGSGRNGKGTIEDVACALLGQENLAHVGLKRMEDRFGAAELRGKLLNTCSETETGALDVTRFKQIASGDLIQAEVKYDPDIVFRPIAKHMISMNAFPTVKDKTSAFFRRILVLEFNVQFGDDRDDKERRQKLMKELDGIFMWAVEGLRRVLQAHEIYTPESVQGAKERFRQRVNNVLAFVEESCELADDKSIHPDELYKAYDKWCEDSKSRAYGKANMYEQLLTNFPKIKKRRFGTRMLFSGIDVRPGEA